MHTVEERNWHLAFTTSTVAPARIGKTRVAPKTGIELGQYYTIGHGMSNQQSSQVCVGRTGRYLQLPAFPFCTAQSLFRTILDHDSL